MPLPKGAARSAAAVSHTSGGVTVAHTLHETCRAAVCRLLLHVDDATTVASDGDVDAVCGAAVGQLSSAGLHTSEGTGFSLVSCRMWYCSNSVRHDVAVQLADALAQRLGAASSSASPSGSGAPRNAAAAAATPAVRAPAVPVTELTTSCCAEPCAVVMELLLER